MCECPACEDGYICRHGVGCIVDEAADAATLSGVVVRQALSDLADAATRGVTKRPLSFAELEAEMRTINAAYSLGLDALKAMEAGRG